MASWSNAQPQLSRISCDDLLQLCDVTICHDRCDRQGRIIHVTQALAAALGTTVDALTGGNNAHMLDAIIPEPFSQLHHALVSVSV
jgi:PAS domain-containing protein